MQNIAGKKLSDNKPIGSTFSPKNNAVRFRPHPGMGFPVSELKAVDTSAERPNAPSTVRSLMALTDITDSGDVPASRGYNVVLGLREHEYHGPCEVNNGPALCTL